MNPLPVDPEERLTMPHLSHSRVSRYLLCPEQYRLYYIQGLRPRMPPATLVFGQIVHQSLADFLQKKVDPIASFEKLWTALQSFSLKFNQRDSWEKLRGIGTALLRQFLYAEFPNIGTVVAVEKKFEFTITGIDTPFVGFIDLVAERHGSQRILDFKTAGSRYDEYEVHLSDQLTAYKLAEPSVHELALCVLVKTSEPRIEWHVTARTETHLVEYLDKIGYVARQIHAGVFYKRPGMWCSWCDFLPICLGDQAKAEATLVRLK